MFHASEIGEKVGFPLASKVKALMTRATTRTSIRSGAFPARSRRKRTKLNEAAGCFGAMGKVATACWRDCSDDGRATDARCCFGKGDLADRVLSARNRS